MPLWGSRAPDQADVAGAYAHETFEFVHCIEIYAMQSVCGVGAERPSLSVRRRTNRSWSHHGVRGMLIAGASSGHSLISVKYRVLVRVCWLIRSHEISRSKIRICLCNCLVLHCPLEGGACRGSSFLSLGLYTDSDL